MTMHTAQEHTMGKRGRPAKAGPRERDGRPSRSAIDDDTLARRDARAKLVRGAYRGSNPDYVLAATPIGIMLGRGMISAEQHHAGETYASLYGRVIRRPFPPVAHPDGGSGHDPLVEHDGDKGREAAFRRGKNMLLAAGRRTCDAVENLVVFGRSPRFLDTAGRRGPGARRGDETELDAVRSGLTILASCYRRR